MYDIKFLWLIGLVFQLRISQIFQYVQLQLFTTHIQKTFTFQKMSIICGSFLIFQKNNVVFMYFYDLCICMRLSKVV